METRIIHYADFLKNVDHRFEKVYEGKIRYSNKKLENIKWVYNSRVLIDEKSANATK